MLRAALVVLSAVCLAACGGASPQADVSGLKLQRKGSGYPTLTGYLVNQGEVAISSADVFVTLYDGDNRPIDDVMVGVRNVAAGDSLRFEQRLDLPASAAKLKYVGLN